MTGQDNPENNPSFLTSFEEEGQECQIFEKTQTLLHKLEQCRNTQENIEEKFIWEILGIVASYFLEKEVSPDIKMSTESIIIMNNGHIFVFISPHANTDDMTMAMQGGSTAVYEAPEVLTQQNPDSRALSWTMGCILYEMLALEPAYYDPDGTNPFAAFMQITEGKKPREVTNGSHALRDLQNNCLELEPGVRPTLEEIQTAAKENLNL